MTTVWGTTIVTQLKTTHFALWNTSCKNLDTETHETVYISTNLKDNTSSSRSCSRNKSCQTSEFEILKTKPDKLKIEVSACNKYILQVTILFLQVTEYI